jgi:hypothetical protein
VRAPVPPHRHDLTEQLMRSDREVLVAVRIAPGHEHEAARIVHARAYDAMGEEAIVQREENDIGDANLLKGARLDDQDVAGPDRREHARTAHLDAGSAEALQHFGNERRSRVGQEFFRTDLHGPLVGLIFPHARAIVSKTCSRMKAGFSYVFLADSCSGACS